MVLENFYPAISKFLKKEKGVIIRSPLLYFTLNYALASLLNFEINLIVTP